MYKISKIYCQYKRYYKQAEEFYPHKSYCSIARRIEYIILPPIIICAGHCLALC